MLDLEAKRRDVGDGRGGVAAQVGKARAVWRNAARRGARMLDTWRRKQCSSEARGVPSLFSGPVRGALSQIAAGRWAARGWSVAYTSDRMRRGLYPIRAHHRSVFNLDHGGPVAGPVCLHMEIPMQNTKHRGAVFLPLKRGAVFSFLLYHDQRADFGKCLADREKKNHLRKSYV